MTNSRDCKQISPKYFANGEWLLNLYIIKYDGTESIADEVVNGIIENCLSELEERCISDEFTYFKTGTIFLHFGQRGIDLSIWHVGQWGSTFEYFSCTWYCYGRNYLDMELLDSAEPKLSQFEVNFLIRELTGYNSILEKQMTKNDFREKYLRLER